MPFADPPNSVALVCRHVLSDKGSILFVSHDRDDGAWQFLCNIQEHGPNDVVIVALHRVLDLDPSLDNVANLPLGFEATRLTAGSDWQVQESTDETE